MPGPRTCFTLPVALALVLLSLSTSALGTATESSGVHEESPAVGGAELLPHPEELSASDNADLEFVKRLYDFGLGKRAYSYVSEYKRLPVYNFGLGKRNKMYGFGLGKRDGRMYSFGLGKRDYDYYGEEDEDDQQSSGDDDIDDSQVGDLVDKRDRLYSFGLGKRARPYSFGLGKRGPSGVQRLYGFGLGKRGGSLYSFGLGKRGEGRLYAFGLGKRPVSSGRSSGSRFNFGLGKRSEDFDIRELEDKFAEEEKRYPQEHRFSFGLGKREVAPSELEAVKNEEKDSASAHDKRNSTRDLHSGERIKRSLHYPFGIRKQESSYDLNSASSLNSEENEDITPEEFSRMVRRPFNFGLGKRIPMYDFGIGKRSER